MKKISIIVAIAEGNAIGKDNKLLCNISQDLKRFKLLTSGHAVVMGKNTWLSLPVRPLPNRKNIVISDNRNDAFDGSIMTYSIQEALDACSPDDENFIIGGASVYKQFFAHATKLYITRINKAFDADTWFPEINDNDWILTDNEANLYDEKNKVSFNYEIYERIH